MSPQAPSQHYLTEIAEEVYNRWIDLIDQLEESFGIPFGYNLMSADEQRQMFQELQAASPEEQVQILQQLEQKLGPEMLQQLLQRQTEKSIGRE